MLGLVLGLVLVLGLAWAGEEEDWLRIRQQVNQGLRDALVACEDEVPSARHVFDRRRIYLSLTLAPDGHTQAVEQTEGSLGSPEADACFIAAIPNLVIAADPPESMRSLPVWFQTEMQPRPDEHLHHLLVQHQDRLDLCHQAATSRDPERFGLVQVQASIPAEGGHADLAPSHDGIGDPTLTRCLLDNMRARQIPSLVEEGVVETTIVFAHLPGRSDAASHRARRSYRACLAELGEVEAFHVLVRARVGRKGLRRLDQDSLAPLSEEQQACLEQAVAEAVAGRSPGQVGLELEWEAE